MAPLKHLAERSRIGPAHLNNNRNNYMDIRHLLNSPTPPPLAAPVLRTPTPPPPAVQPPQPAVPSTPQRLVGDSSAEERFRSLYVTPPAQLQAKQRHKRMISTGVDALYEGAGRSRPWNPQTPSAIRAMRSPLFRSSPENRQRATAETGSKPSTPLPPASSPAARIFGGPLVRAEGIGAAEPNIAARKFTSDDAKAATIMEASSELTRLFPFTPEEMKKIFGCENQAVKSISTELAKNIDEETGDLIPKGSVSFSNFYGSSVWIMASNYRDPELADFHMNDIIRLQARHAEASQKPEYMVRKMISSEKAQAFFENNRFAHNEVMDDAQFEKFMNETPNGKSSMRILKELGLKAESARVLIYKDEEEYETESDEEYAPQSQGEEDLLYSVVLKTAPLNAAKDEQKTASVASASDPTKS